MAFEVQVFILVPEDVLWGETGDLETRLLIKTEEFRTYFVCEGCSCAVVVRVGLGGFRRRRLRLGGAGFGP